VDRIIEKRKEQRLKSKNAEPDLLDIFLDYMENPTVEGFVIDNHFIK
jgi:hypothetical protein